MCGHTDNSVNRRMMSDKLNLGAICQFLGFFPRPHSNIDVWWLLGQQQEVLGVLQLLISHNAVI